MSANRGSALLTDIRHGTVNINEVRKGTILVWTRSTKRDDFDRDDALDLGPNWTDEGPSGDHLLGVENGQCRQRIPDGLLGGFWSLRTSRFRYNLATSIGDDGYIECRPSTRGDGKSATSLVGYTTQVFGRGSNSAATHGVGIWMAAGSCGIVSRISNVDTKRGDTLPYQPGDRLRLTYVGDLHTLFKNGTQVSQWNDSGSAASKGSGYRSMIVRGDGAKDLLGPRRFSPALDYVLMS